MPKAAPAKTVQPQEGIETWLADKGAPFHFDHRQQLWELIRWNGQQLDDPYWFDSKGRPQSSGDRKAQDEKLLKALKKDAEVPRIVIVDKNGKPISSIDSGDKKIHATLDPLPEEPWEIFNSLNTNPGTPSISKSKPIAELGVLNFDNGNFFVRAKWKHDVDTQSKVTSRDMFVVLSRLEDQDQCTLDHSQFSWETNDNENELPERTYTPDWLDSVWAGFEMVWDTAIIHPEVWNKIFTSRRFLKYAEQNITSIAWSITVCGFTPIAPMFAGMCLPMVGQTGLNIFMYLLKELVVETRTIILSSCIPEIDPEPCFPQAMHDAVQDVLDIGDAALQIRFSPPSDPKRLKRICKVLEPSSTALRVLAPRQVVDLMDPSDSNAKRAQEFSINMILQQGEKMVGALCQYASK